MVPLPGFQLCGNGLVPRLFRKVLLLENQIPANRVVGEPEDRFPILLPGFEQRGLPPPLPLGIEEELHAPLRSRPVKFTGVRGLPPLRPETGRQRVEEETSVSIELERLPRRSGRKQLRIPSADRKTGCTAQLQLRNPKGRRDRGPFRQRQTVHRSGVQKILHRELRDKFPRPGIQSSALAHRDRLARDNRHGEPARINRRGRQGISRRIQLAEIQGEEERQRRLRPEAPLQMDGLALRFPVDLLFE